MAESTFEEVIAREGRLVYSNVGDSMMPLIRQGRDLLIIERPQGRLKRYDVPLYRRDDGRYILHRVLRTRPEDYVICGDHQWRPEYGITDRHIIGVLTAVVRDGQTLPMTHWKQRLYAHLWCDLFPLRAAILFFKYALRRLKARYEK